MLVKIGQKSCRISNKKSFEYQLPDGFLANDFSFGKSTIHSDQNGDRYYKAFILEKFNLINRTEIIKHYKCLVKDNVWEVKWDLSEDCKTG